MADESKREFIGKLVTAAGAVAVAGLLAGSQEADGAVEMFPKIDGMKIGQGFRLIIRGKQLGEAIANAGLINRGANLDNSKMLIEFTY